MAGSPDWVLGAALLVGCVVLYFGAEWLVHGAVTVATALGISKEVVGLTLVAFGTSAPEMFVNVIAAWNGQTGIALANVSGSNLTNMCIGFGACSLVACVVIDWKAFAADCFMAVLSVGVVLAFLLYYGAAGLPVWAMAPLLGLLVLYMVSLRRRASNGGQGKDPNVSRAKLLLNVGLFLLGVSMLYCGGQLLLDAAVETADRVGMPPSLVGLTIIAAGTSIPDTVASLVAARRGEHGIAIGNLLGSNISNVLVVLSATLAASGTALSTGGDVYLAQDYVMVVAVSAVFLFIAASLGRMNRAWGVFFLLAYFGYMGYRIHISLPAVGAAGV